MLNRNQPIKYPYETPPAPGKAIEVAQGILWLRLPLPMKLDHVNVYALDDGDGWTIIDTGFDTGRTRSEWQVLLDGPLGGRPVRRVIATHHHPDHIGLAGWFQVEQGAEILATRTAWLMARMLTLDTDDTPKAETIDFYRAAGMDPEILEKRRTERPFNFADMVVLLRPGFTRLQEGQTIHMGGRDWDIRVGHGHAPEAATFWCRQEPLVIAGDQIIASISPNLGVYPTEPDADPVAEWLESCERLAGYAQEDHLVMAGHKLVFTGLPTRMTQLIENHHSALARLADHLDQPKTAAECFLPLFKRQIGPAEYGLALVEAVAHLNHLLASGQASRTRRERDGAWLWSRS